MLIIDQLLDLQATDTAADQLRHRIAHLPELVAAQHAREQVVEWERRRTLLRERLAELEATIEESEADGSEIGKHLSRLQAQLRTVIAPREAEALQHEIQILTDRRGGLDDRELAALEEQSTLDDELVAHVAIESALREALELSNSDLARVQGDLGAELDALEAHREELRSGFTSELLARYDRLRSHLGVAVARLVGHRCEGCHLDLSAAEVDIIKDVPADELPECPQCSRLLIR